MATLSPVSEAPPAFFCPCSQHSLTTDPGRYPGALLPVSSPLLLHSPSQTLQAGCCSVLKLLHAFPVSTGSISDSTHRRPGGPSAGTGLRRAPPSPATCTSDSSAFLSQDFTRNAPPPWLTSTSATPHWSCPTGPTGRFPQGRRALLQIATALFSLTIYS